MTMKFTPEQEEYIRNRGEQLVDSTQSRLWGLYGMVIIGYFILPGAAAWFATGLFVVGFFWMVLSQKKRTARIMGLSYNKKEKKNDDAD